MIDLYQDPATGCRRFWDVIPATGNMRLFVGGPVHGDLLEVPADATPMNVTTADETTHEYTGTKIWTCFGTVLTVYYLSEIPLENLRILLADTPFAVLFQCDVDTAWPP